MSQWCLKYLFQLSQLCFVQEHKKAMPYYVDVDFYPLNMGIPSNVIITGPTYPLPYMY